MGVELPFTYGKPHTSPSEYYRLDPKIYSRNLYNNVPKKTKAKIEEPKVVRNVKNLPKHLIGRVHTADNVQNNMKDALQFGRPGCGAPVRTKSGHIKTIITGNPEIRFNNNDSVQKTIYNNIRYQSNREEKNIYNKELEGQVKEKQQKIAAAKQNEFSVARHLGEVEGTQWGKPGPGGKYWRDSAISGQGFLDKMGWSRSGDPRKRERSVKRHEAEDLKRDIENIEVRRYNEHQDVTSDIGIELVPLMNNKSTGKPRKDPSTGYMKSHSLSSTDITKHADKKIQPWQIPSNGNKRQYWEQLTGQVGEKQDIFVRKRDLDEQQQRQHFQSWESFWGRPGYGAPRDVTNKENLMKMLHYPASVKNNPNNIELISLERLPVK